MLTNNYYKAFKCVATGEPQTINTYNGGTFNIGTGNLNTSFRMYIAFTETATVGTDYSSSLNGVHFGNGTVPPTADDYCMSGAVIDTINQTSVKEWHENDDGSFSVDTIYTITNTSDTDITISEIGYFCSYGQKAMIEHTLLDEPVTIPAGGVGQVTYTITFNIA